MKTATRSTILAAVLIGAAVPVLQGCFPVVAAGVGAGALMIVDRRNSETYLADEAIEIRAVSRINEKFGERAHINVTSYNLKVLLTGEAPDANQAAEVEKLVASVPNVKAVTNEIQAAGVSNFSARSNDSFITSKVKGRFIEANKFQPQHVKVVTEAGTVFLLGLVTRKEADDAAEVARTTGGVRKVVRVFDYIGEDEARRLDNRPPEDTKPKQKQ
jgi:osmotically-inducible protein OsmY